MTQLTEENRSVIGDIVKRSADRVTATNRQDGLAQVLEEWF